MKYTFSYVLYVYLIIFSLFHLTPKMKKVFSDICASLNVSEYLIILLNIWTFF